MKSVSEVAPTLEAERAAFEAWHHTEHNSDLTLSRDQYGNYVGLWTASAWRVWQAARRAVPVAEGLPALSKAEALGTTFGGGDFVYGYTAEQVRQAQREAVEADRRARSDVVIPISAQSIDTVEFREYVRKCSITWDTYEWDAHLSDLIAYIDGSTAGTAPEELIEIGNRMATTLEVLACALKNPSTAEGVRRTVEEWRAVAPSPLPPQEEDK